MPHQPSGLKHRRALTVAFDCRVIPSSVDHQAAEAGIDSNEHPRGQQQTGHDQKAPAAAPRGPGQPDCRGAGEHGDHGQHTTAAGRGQDQHQCEGGGEEPEPAPSPGCGQSENSEPGCAENGKARGVDGMTERVRIADRQRGRQRGAGPPGRQHPRKQPEAQTNTDEQHHQQSNCPGKLRGPLLPAHRVALNPVQSEIG